MMELKVSTVEKFCGHQQRDSVIENDGQRLGREADLDADVFERCVWR